jgi:hypothetical protein
MTEPRALAPDANERSEDKPAASYIWARANGSMIEGIKLSSMGPLKTH